MIKGIQVFLELTKLRISLFATFSTSAGFILAKQGLSREVIIPIVGIFFLACGSCALNQYQERKIDPLMKRTERRPIPSGKLRPNTALIISIGLIFLGLAILFYGANVMAWGLGLFAIVWYNGVYTYLKRKSAFAVIPGALIGAVPPLLGWVSGGGYPFDPQILAVALFFFIWQVPHFWLLLLEFGNDYERTGFPSLTRIFTSAQLRRITLMWILATAVTCMVIPLYGVVESHSIRGGLFVAAFWLVWKGFRILKVRSPEFSFHFSFNSINSYALLVMALITLDTLFK